MGPLTLLQGIFPTQGSNPGLPHCRWILYQLSYEGSPKEWTLKRKVTNLFTRQKQNLRHRKETNGDFSGGPVVKNPPSDVGDVGSIPGRETKISYTSGQLSPHTQLLSLRATPGEAQVLQ